MMKQVLGFMAAGLLWAGSASGQVQVLFDKTYPNGQGGYPAAVVVRSDGTFQLAANHRPSFTANSNIHLLEADSAGNLLAQYYTGSPDSSFGCFSMRETYDHHLIMAGYNGYEPRLFKTTRQGQLVWQRAFAGPHYIEDGLSVMETTDHGYICAGHGNGNTYVYKVSESGSLLWSQTLPDVLCPSVVQTADGGFALTGRTDTANAQVCLVKLSAAGQQIWMRQYGGPGIDWGTTLVQLPDGGYMIGAEYGPILVDDSHQTYLLRTTAQGDTLWTKRLSFGKPLHLALSHDGQVVFSSYSYTRSMQPLIFPDTHNWAFSKFGLNGSMVWSRWFYDVTGAVNNNIALTPDGGYVMAGEPINSGAVRLVKFDSLGHFITGMPAQTVQAAPQATVFPNPFSDQLTISICLATDEVPQYIRLFDLMGRKVAEVPVQRSGGGAQQITWRPARQLPPGHYVAQLATSRQVTTFKISKAE